ncbi:MAG: hypothetical protein ACLQVD_08055 [Capsulimonadaceae bacterium]
MGNLAANGLISGLMTIWLAPHLSLVIVGLIGLGVAAVVEAVAGIIHRRMDVDRVVYDLGLYETRITRRSRR